MLQAAGEDDGEPATLRVRVHDAADPGAGTETFQLEVAMADLTLDSGVVVLDYGEITVGTMTEAP